MKTQSSLPKPFSLVLYLFHQATPSSPRRGSFSLIPSIKFSFRSAWLWASFRIWIFSFPLEFLPFSSGGCLNSTDQHGGGRIRILGGRSNEDYEDLYLFVGLVFMFFIFVFQGFVGIHDSIWNVLLWSSFISGPSLWLSIFDVPLNPDGFTLSYCKPVIVASL